MRRLGTVSARTRRESQRILSVAAKPLVEEIRARAPQSPAEHYRYKDGKKVATYVPGNLGMSFQVLPLRRMRSVIVGPKAARTASGRFGSSERKTDGYYAHMVEFGTIHQSAQPFVRPALMATSKKVLLAGVNGLRKLIEQTLGA